MQKLSWKSIQEQFPKYAVKYKNEFRELFTKSGKSELSIEDIDDYLATETSIVAYKIGSYIRYFQDNTGQMIGRVEVSDDNGDSRAFDATGALQGYVINGFTYNAQGELLAQSDIISSLLVKENRIQANKKASQECAGCGRYFNTELVNHYGMAIYLCPTCLNKEKEIVENLLLVTEKKSFRNLVNWFKQASSYGHHKTVRLKRIENYDVILEDVWFYDEQGERKDKHNEVLIFSTTDFETKYTSKFDSYIDASAYYNSIENIEYIKGILNLSKQASYELEKFKSKTIGDYEVQLNEVYFEEDTKRSYDSSEVSLWPVEYSKGKPGKLPSREPIKIKKFYDMVEAEEMYTKINTEEDFNLLNTKHATTEQVLYIDYASGKFESWFYSEGDKNRYISSYDIDEIISNAKGDDFTKFILTEEAKMFRRGNKKADSPLEIVVKDETGRELQRMDSVQFMKAMEAPRNMNVADGIKKYNETHSEKAELVVKTSNKKADALQTKGFPFDKKYSLSEIKMMVRDQDITTIQYKELLKQYWEDRGDVPMYANPVDIQHRQHVELPKQADTTEQATLFDINTVDEVINKLQSELQIPFVQAYKSTLGGADRVTIMIKVSLDAKDTWAGGYFENSRRLNFSVERDGTVEQFSKSFKIPTKFRKTKVKSIEDLITKLNTYFASVRNIVAMKQAYKALKLRWISTLNKFSTDRIEDRPILRQLQKEAGLPVTGYITEQEYDAILKAASEYGWAIETESSEIIASTKQADERLINPHIYVPESYSPLYEERTPNPAEWTSYSMEDITEDEEEQPSKYIPKKKQRGKYNLHEIVLTPEGRGRIVMKQVDYKPFNYTVALTGKDEITIVEESQIQRLASINKQAYYLKEYLKNPSVVNKAKRDGLIAIENEDLTILGLIAKMYEWDEMEHGVPSYIYDMTEKELESQGEEMPEDIRRIEEGIKSYNMGNIAKQAKRNDARYFATVQLEVWVDGRMLETADTDIVKIRNSKDSETDKIYKAEHEVKYLVERALDSLQINSQYSDAISINNIHQTSIEVDERYHDIDYVSLVTPENEELEKESSLTKMSYIEKKEDGYYVRGEKGKNLGGSYNSRDEAEERLREVEYFKHKGDSIKEPWEMTENEYKHQVINNGEWEKKEKTHWLYEEAQTANPSLKKAWEMDIYLATDKTFSWLHKKAIIKALSEGKLVPAEVLADYPDLQKQGNKSAKSVGWLRDKFLNKIEKIADVAAEVNDEFKKEREDGEGKGVSLMEYYTTGRYHGIEKPLSEDAITKSQAEKLMEDLVYQFKTELFAIYNISSNKADDIVEEPKGVSMKDIEELEEATEKEAVIESTKQKYIVVDNDFNRTHYKDLIGRIFDTAPSYAQVKVIDENTEKESAIEKEITYYPMDSISTGYPSTQYLKDIVEPVKQPEGKYLSY